MVYLIFLKRYQVSCQILSLDRGKMQKVAWRGEEMKRGRGEEVRR